MTLPEPSTVLERADRLASETGGKTAGANLLVLGSEAIDPEQTTLDSGGYDGPQAGAVGRLQAAVGAVDSAESARLHHPGIGAGTSGPWIVLAPLGGRLATVYRGSARLEVTWPSPKAGVDASLRRQAGQVDAVLEAARPTHRWYPVDRDERGVFTRGLTTFSLADISVEGETTTLGFDVRTTPATDPAAIAERFSAVDGVEDVHYEAGTSVAKAAPEDGLRTAVEEAAETVLGDWAYEWAPGPSTFSNVPTPNRIALGTDAPGATHVTEDTLGTCRDLLTAVLENLEGRA